MRFPPYQYRDANGLWDKNGAFRLPGIEEREAIMGFPIHYTKACFPKSHQNKTEYLDERLTLIGNSWCVFVIAWLLKELCAMRGLCPHYSLQQVVAQCSPMGNGVVQTALRRQPLRRMHHTASTSQEDALVKKLMGLVSMKGEDILLQHQSEETLKYQRLRASLPAKLWKWKDICGWTWKNPQEHINGLELRAVLTSIRWRLLKKGAVKKRFIHLVDSLVCLHCLARGRSSSKKLKRTLLRINSLLLVSGCQPVWAYVNTSDNPADKPSRRPVRKKWLKGK